MLFIVFTYLLIIYVIPILDNGIWLLLKNNISFECEKIFPTCKNPKTNYPLRFDFFVDNKYLIEYNGK